MRGVYIHIPFCKSICSYCDFCKFLYSPSWAGEYLKALEREIKEKYDNDEIKSIYIGGGTPSCLSKEEILNLFRIIKIFKINSKCEITFELNVDDISINLLEILKENGINRISIGIQSFNDINLKFMNRKHNKKEIKEKIKLAKNYFNNINVDFMFALPIENYSMFLSDLHEFINLNVPHLSTYSLIIEDNTILSYKKIEPIKEELDYRMYKKICRTLNRKGYVHYEISNFAKPGYESVHNLNYWNNDEYYGFGLGAHGYISELRYENTRALNDYLEGNYRLKEFIISKREDMENEIILGLRKINGINIKDFFDKFKINIQDEFNITSLIKKGYLELEDNFLKIKEDKIYIMNEILNKILDKGEQNE